MNRLLERVRLSGFVRPPFLVRPLKLNRPDRGTSRPATVLAAGTVRTGSLAG